MPGRHHHDRRSPGADQSPWQDDRGKTDEAPRAGGHYKPHLESLLRTLQLDVHYHRACGDSVYYLDAEGEEIEVLDLVGGYGCLLLGHGHPELVAEADRFFRSGAGTFLQGSASRLAARLACELSQRVELDGCVVLASTGAEAVEAAMKHALLETGGRSFLTLEGAFHGKTLGALQLTSSRFYRGPFALPGIDVLRLPINDVEQLEAAFERAERPAGFFFEPIQGEGGVREVEGPFLQRAAELCAERQIPFIADECQTGLGRTGTFLACQAWGLKPDYVILSKALGGGLAKISAVIIDRRRYRGEFDLLHSSTFGADGFSCAIALKTLELLDQTTLASCRRKGSLLAAGLRRLQQKYPAAIAAVRGRGLLWGVELAKPTDDDGFLLRFLAAGEWLGLCVAAKLLWSHRIRVAPTLSDPWTLRLQPSAGVSEKSLRRLVDALDRVLRQLADRDMASLTDFLASGADREPATVAATGPGRTEGVPFRPAGRTPHRPSASRRRAAWLFHLVDGNDLPHLEPALARLGGADRQAFLDRMAPLARPVVMEPVQITSAAGERVELLPILLPVTSRWLRNQLDRRRVRRLRALVQQAVDVAAALRCDAVSLGQFTSIVTGQGRGLRAPNMGIGSGNSLTAATTVDAVRGALARRGIDAAAIRLAIVGGGGDIGGACAQLLVPDFRSALLVGSGRPASAARLQQLARDCNAVAGVDLTAVREAGVVICATNCVDFPLRAEHLSRDAIVCDVSMPATLDPASLSARPDVTLLRGGLVQLPGGEDLGIPGLPLPAGSAHGCLGEGVLLAWAGRRDARFAGRTCSRKVSEMAALARRYGLLPVEHEQLATISVAPPGGDGVPADCL